MTDEERTEETVEEEIEVEEIEDLEAPAEALRDVAGGAAVRDCGNSWCMPPHSEQNCEPPTCVETVVRARVAL